MAEASAAAALCVLLDDAVAAQLTTSALVAKIRELMEENAQLKAQLRRYRERDEAFAYDEASAASFAYDEPSVEPPVDPQEPSVEPSVEPPFTPQEWMRRRAHEPAQTGATPDTTVRPESGVPVHMWREPRTTLPRHPLCHQARSLTPHTSNTVVRSACGAGPAATAAATRGASTMASTLQPAVAGGLEEMQAGPPTSLQFSKQRDRDAAEPFDSPRATKGHYVATPLVAAAFGARCFEHESARALIGVKAGLEKQTALGLREPEHGLREPSVRALIEAGAASDAFRSTAGAAWRSATLRDAFCYSGVGVAIDTPDSQGYTPLMSACRNGHELSVRALIEARADLNATRNQQHVEKPLLGAEPNLATLSVAPEYMDLKIAQ